MATSYADQDSLRNFAAFTPEEEAASSAYERSPGNIAELNSAIARERRPDVVAMLQQELAKQTGTPMGMQAIERSSQSQPQPATPSGATSSRTSTSGNTFDPALMAAALNSGLSIISQGGSLDTAQAAIEAANQQRQQAEQAQIAAITDYASKQGAATAASTAVDVAAATRRAAILRAGNINADDINNKVNQAFDSINTLDPQLETLGQDIDNRMAVGIFDNPLEWLINQTRLPGMVGQYNSLARQQNRSIESAKTLQSLAGTQQALNSALDADEIAVAGRAKAAADASAATVKLTEVQERAAGAAARDAANTLQLAGQKFTVAEKMAQLTKEHFMESEGLSERDASRKAEQVQVDEVNKYLKMIGSSLQYTPQQFKLLPSKTRDELLAATGTGKIADKFSDAAEIINRFGNADRIAATGDAGAMNWLRATVAQAQRDTEVELKVANLSAAQTGKVIKREEFLTKNLDKIQTLYTAETVDMRTASDNNPIKLAYPALAKLPALAANPVAKYINEVGPLSANPIMPKIDERLLLNRFATSPAEIPAAAAAISQFYTVATQLQAEKTKYLLFGLSKPAGYTVKLPSNGFFGGLTRGFQAEGTVDLTSQAAVEAYLSRQVAGKIVETLDTASPFVTNATGFQP